MEVPSDVKKLQKSYLTSKERLLKFYVILISRKVNLKTQLSKIKWIMPFVDTKIYLQMVYDCMKKGF